VFVFVVGVGVALPTVCVWLVLSRVAADAVRTEAATWISSAGAVGAALGAAAVGKTVDAAGARTALVAASVSGGAVFLVVLARERTMREAVAA
jgi:predicted MFS family arabinose efflux permease